MSNPNNPKKKSWIQIDSDSLFPIQNLPFGVFRMKNGKYSVGTRIGDTVIDLDELNKLEYFKKLNLNENIFNSDSLNNLLKLNKKKWTEIRNNISDIFDVNNNMKIEHKKKLLHSLSSIEMTMPVRFSGFTDFYSSKQHAINIGSIFRNSKNPLPTNWHKMPIAYNARSSSIILSNSNIKRPKGQINSELPHVYPTSFLDFEVEIGFILGKGSKLGNSISTEEADEYVFGLCLLNDWSARDIQKLEYVPLGPFNGKNFATSISPWIITTDALEPFKVEGEKQIPDVLPYLKFEGKKNFDINIEVFLKSNTFQKKKLLSTNAKYLYWNINQQIAHHTISGCNVNIGDIYGSGTISGSKNNEFGSMIELTWNGKKPIEMSDGSLRKAIHDNDTVIFKGKCSNENYSIGFGSLVTKILPG